jgi:hypothetical protein
MLICTAPALGAIHIGVVLGLLIAQLLNASKMHTLCMLLLFGGPDINDDDAFIFGPQLIDQKFNYLGIVLVNPSSLQTIQQNLQRTIYIPLTLIWGVQINFHV